MPLFGHSSKELDQARQDGRSEGESRALLDLKQSLRAELERFFDNELRSRIEKRWYGQPQQVKEFLINLFNGLISELSSTNINLQMAQARIEELRQTRQQLEAQLAQTVIPELHRQLDQRTLERDTARRELAQCRDQWAAERRQLEQRIAKLQKEMEEYELKIVLDETNRSPRKK